MVNIRTPDGSVEVIGSDAHFKDLIRRYVGDDAVDYLDENYSNNSAVSDDPVDARCGGECSHTYEIQEAYEDELYSIRCELDSLDLLSMTKKEGQQKLNEIIEKMKQI